MGRSSFDTAQFPEIQAEGYTPGEALLALQSILRRSAGWTTDTWHANDLAHAIIDLESILRLLDCSDEAINYSGRGSLLVKNEDLIYYSSDRPVEAGASPANPVDDRPAFVEPPCDAAETDSLLIYTLGRRRAMRRQPEGGEAPRTGSDRAPHVRSADARPAAAQSHPLDLRRSEFFRSTGGARDGGVESRRLERDLTRPGRVGIRDIARVLRVLRRKIDGTRMLVRLNGEGRGCNGGRHEHIPLIRETRVFRLAGLVRWCEKPAALLACTSCSVP